MPRCRTSFDLIIEHRVLAITPERNYSEGEMFVHENDLRQYRTIPA